MATLEPYDGIVKSIKKGDLMIYTIVSNSIGADSILYALNVAKTDSWFSLCSFMLYFSSTLSKKLIQKLSPIIKLAPKATFIA